MREPSIERQQEIFHHCVELPRSERHRYLDDACGSDTVVRARLERLLAAHEHAEQNTLTPLRSLPLDTMVDRIGPYRLIRVLGEGGMGIVYEAEQQEPVQRRVALKVVKLGMDTREVIRRFMAERQALAAMDHPSVAKVFDAGHTVAGRPYFVMERVDGVPLLEYCDAHQLSIPRRVELAALVCQAVQHAHQKGVIHRDLKPSNVLVATSDGTPLPKIIDFGIAKAAGLDLQRHGTAHTRADQTLGTPAYMSPEQAGREGQDVDTRTDVYSLGVILYELLTGQLPADPAATGSSNFLVALAQGDVLPKKPSVRVTAFDATEIALRRSTTVRGLRRQLEGDLDWICMKALEVDRNRRYDTPLALAEDLRRSLASEAVLAGPPSRIYRLRRLARRHRATMAAAAVAVLALLVGSAAAITQAVRATEAERNARADAETARQVSDFMVGLFEVSDPNAANRSTVTARELLDQGATRIQRDLETQPLVRARVQAVIGEIYRKLGLYDPAAPLLEQSLAARQQLLEGNSVEVVQTLQSIARLKFERGDNSGAEATLRDALQRFASAPEPDPVVRARLQCELGQVLRDKAEFAEAERLFHDAIDTLTRALGAEHREVGAAWAGLAPVFHNQGKFADAERAYKNAIAIKEKAFSPDHPELAGTLVNLASTLGRMGRDAEAEPILLRAIEALERTYGPHHVSVLSALSSLAAGYGRQGRLDDSEATLRKTLAIRERIYGPDHPNTVIELKNLGLTAMLKGDYQGARRAFERNLEVETKAFGPNHPRVLWTVTRMGGLHLNLAEFDAAEAAYRRALTTLEKALGPDNIETVSNVRGLGMVALRRGRLDEANTWLERALAAANKAPHADVPNTWKAVAELRLRQERLDEAREWLEKARAHESKIYRTGHPATGHTLVLMADVMRAQGQHSEAARLYHEAAQLAERALGPTHLDVARALHGLGRLSAHTSGDALGALDRAFEIRVARLGSAHPDTRETARLRADLRLATAR
jgi:serine/threonine protein kinase/Tfp pilus assembly protein PilF